MTLTAQPEESPGIAPGARRHIPERVTRGPGRGAPWRIPMLANPPPRTPSLRVMRSMAAGLLMLLFFSLMAPLSQAVPHFSRKYGVSCSSCHGIFPSLTPFGEVFRRNGYRWPGGVEARSLAQDPLAITRGTAGNVGGFFDSTIARSIPLSVQLFAEEAITMDRHGAFDPNEELNSEGFDSNLSGFLDHENLYVAGTLGDRTSYFVNLGFGLGGGGGHAHGENSGFFDAGLSVDDASPHFHRMFVGFRLTPGPEAIVRFGQFEPRMFLSTHAHNPNPAITIATLTDTLIGANNFTIDESQSGVELGGVLFRRAFYAFGIVEGRTGGSDTLGPRTIRNDHKDTYLQIGYKIGGLPLDGTIPEGGIPQGERSVMVALFHYRGNTRIEGLVVPGAPQSLEEIEQDDRFNFTGTEVAGRWGPVQVNVGGFLRSDASPGALTFESSGIFQEFVFLDPRLDGRRGSSAMFVTSQVVVLPWLVPFLQAEYLEQESSVGDLQRNRIAFGVNVAVQTNFIVGVGFLRDEDEREVGEVVTQETFFVGGRLGI